MPIFDDCPHVDEREADLYGEHLDRVEDTPIREPQIDDGRDLQVRGAGSDGVVGLSRGAFVTGPPSIEFVDPCVVERVKGMPPLDKGEEQ